MENKPESECPGNACLANWLRWIKAGEGCTTPGPKKSLEQSLLFEGTAYEDSAPAIRDTSEFQSAVETLAFAIFRLNHNRLTRAERPRIENLIDNAIFKMSRFVERNTNAITSSVLSEYDSLKAEVAESRRLSDLKKRTAQGIKQKLEQLEQLSPEAFEDFVGEVFEAMGHEVQRVGGPGDNGADLLLKRGPAQFVVQCKYYKKGVIGSPDLQKFLGTIHQTQSQKGYFVTTSTFSLSAEKFAANQAIELVDGPRLAELVRELVAMDRTTGDEKDLPFF